MNIIAQQGDVMIVEMDSIGDNPGSIIEQENDRVILVRGEATGHHHSIPANDGVFTLFDDDPSVLNGTVIGSLETWRETTLDHQQHHTCTIPKGKFFVVRQREFVRGKIVRVMD